MPATGATSAEAVLAACAHDGWADEDGEVTRGLASVGVVVRDHLGWPAAAIAVTFPRENIEPSRWPRTGRRDPRDREPAHPPHPRVRHRMRFFEPTQISRMT